MATPSFVNHSATCPTADVETMSLVARIPRQRDGGFFDSDAGQLPYDLMVNDWQDLSARYAPGVGFVETSLVSVIDRLERFKAPSRFVVRKVIPQEQKFATSVDMMPPLGTRVNGYNTYIARKLAQQGIHNRIVGTNQTRGYSLLHDTQATLTILKADDERNSFAGSSCTPNASVDLGYSMGAMKGFAKLVLAPYFGRTILLNKSIDPCVAQATGYGDLLTKEMASYFAADAALIPKNMIQNAKDTGLIPTMARSRHWFKTVGWSRQFAGNTYDKWRTILTGEAGTFIPAAPKGTPIVLHSFNGSQLNHRDVFESQLADFPHARFVREPGRHLSAACSAAVANLAIDMAASLELIESGASQSDIAEASQLPLLRKR